MNHEAFYKITYGLYVVSSTNGSQGNGYVANTVFQVTSKPARFAVACNKDNFTCGLISQSQVFAVSVLQQDTKADLIGLFGYKSGRGLDKFASVRHRTGQTGAPILLEDSLAWFECKVVQTLDVGTHLLFVGEVVDGDVIDLSLPPLTYAYYRDVKKGKSPKNAPTYVEPAKNDAPSKAPLASEEYVCPACGYVYDPAVGDPEGGIPPGTRFEDIPENWVCPVCGLPKSAFVKQSHDSPSTSEMPMKTPVIAQKSPAVQKAEKGTYYWCACGKSKKQPFCDGSHQGTEFTPLKVEIAETKTVAWCLCKHTKNPPFCDGSHKQL